MSVNREQNYAPNTSSLLEIPLKKRKDSRFQAYLSISHDDRNQFTQQESKQGDASLMMDLESHKKKICGSLAKFDDGRYINPYLIHQGSNIATQEERKEEGSHHLVSDVTSLIPKQYDWLPVSNLNSTGQDQMAQASFSSSHLCTASSNPLGLPRNTSDHEHSEIPGGTSSSMQVRSGEGTHNFASSLIPKCDSPLHVGYLNKIKSAYANLSSPFPKMRPLDTSDGSTRNKADPKCSEIARDRTSNMEVGSVGHSTHILQKPLVRPIGATSISQDDSVPLYYGLSPSSPVIHKKSNLPTSVFDIKSMDPQFKFGDVSSLKSCESQLHPSSKFDIETKVLIKKNRPLPLLKSCKSEPYPGSESDIHTDSLSSMKLHEREPHSKFDFNIHSKDAQPKSGPTSSMNIHEQVICPTSKWNYQMPGQYKIWNPFVAQLSNSPECLKGNGNDPSEVCIPLKNKIICSESNVSIEGPKMVLKKCNLLRQDIGRISHSEIGSGSEVDTIHKQKSPCSYNKSKVNLEKQVVKKKSTAKQRYHRKVDTKMEQGAVRQKGLLYKDNSCVLKDPYGNMSRNISMKCKEVQNDADCCGAAKKDKSCKSYVKNEDTRNCLEQEVILCIDETRLLNGERDNNGTIDQEETILLSDDSNDDEISDICVRDGFVEIHDSDDDIEIVHCVSKSNRSRDFPTQRKPLDFTKKPMNNNEFKSSVQNMFAHPREDGSVLSFSKVSVTSNESADLNEIFKRQIDEELSHWKHLHKPEPINDLNPNSSTSRTCDDNDIMSQFQAMSPLHFDVNDPPPTFRRDVCDLSYNTAHRGTPYFFPSHNVSEFPKRTVHSIQYTHGRKCLPEDVDSSSEYPSSSDIPSPPSSCDSSSSSPPNKKDGCLVASCNITKYLSKPTLAWNSAIPFQKFSHFSTSNFMASSSECVISEKSAECDNHNDVLEQTPIHSTLEIVGASSNVQENQEILKMKEILRSSASDTNKEKQQHIAAEDKTEATHKDSRPDWECAICLDTISSRQGISATMCGHVYCTPCITEVVSKKKECPTCRKALDATQVHPLFIFG